MTNEELLQRHMNGDASALEQLYEQNIGLIKRIAEKCLMDFGYLSQDAGGFGKSRFTYWRATAGTVQRRNSGLL